MGSMSRQKRGLGKKDFVVLIKGYIALIVCGKKKKVNLRKIGTERYRYGILCVEYYILRE